MKKLWALGLLASAQIGIAAESFGGIGLAIYPSESGDGRGGSYRI